MRKFAPEDEEEGMPPDAMLLSMPELECAAGHALGVYGDLDEFVGEAVREMRLAVPFGHVPLVGDYLR